MAASQVTPATGLGAVLLLTPLEGSSFEAWRPLRNGACIASTLR